MLLTPIYTLLSILSIPFVKHAKKVIYGYSKKNSKEILEITKLKQEVKLFLSERSNLKNNN